MAPTISQGELSRVQTITGVTTFSPFGIGKIGVLLPLEFGDIKIYKQNNDLNVDWSTYDELNVDHFEIERSQNGRQFVTAGTTSAKGNGKGSRTDYSWIDHSAFSGTFYYRIKEVDIDGMSKYSSIVRVDLDEGNSKFYLFPNPVIDKKVLVQASIEQGQYNIVVSDLDGKKIYDQTLDHSGGIVSQSVQLPSATPPGMYVLTIRGTGVKLFQQFIVR
jgi:hypothetical protein